MFTIAHDPRLGEQEKPARQQVVDLARVALDEPGGLQREHV
jgi:hypothetical protein